MTGKDIIDLCASIIKRQDFDRVLCLSFANSIRRNIIRNQYITSNETIREVSYGAFGEVSVYDEGIKYVSDIEYLNTTGGRRTLGRLPDYDTAKRLFDFDANGEPTHYLLYGEIIKLLPVPTDGVVRVLGEFYPVSLQDNAVAIDPMGRDLGEAIAYLAAAEYFDMLDELQKGVFWRNKGSQYVVEFVKYLKRKNSDNINLMYRDPFGNLGYDPALTPGVEAVDETEFVVDGGTPEDIYSTNNIYDGGGVNG